MSEKKAAANNTLLTIFITALIDLLGIGIIIPIIGPLFFDSDYIFSHSSSYAFRTQMLGLLIASFSIFQFFSGPFLGSLSDKYGRKKIIFGSLFMTLAGYLVFAAGIWYREAVWLFVGRAMAGMAAGNLSVVYSSIADLSTPETKAKNFGLVGAAFGLGFIIGPVVGGILSDKTVVSWFNPSTPILFSALLVLVNIMLVAFRFPETNTNLRHDAKTSLMGAFTNIGKVFNSGNLRVIYLIIFLYFFGFNIFTQFFQVFLIKKFHFREANIGYVFGAVGICGVFTQGFLVRILSKKFNPKQVLMYSLPGLAFAYLVYLLPEQPWAIYLCVPFYAISQGTSMPNLNAIVSNEAPVELQGETLGMQQSVQSLAQIITPFIGAWVVAKTFYAPMWIGAVVTFIAWLIFWYRVKK